MIVIQDTLAGDRIEFNYVTNAADASKAYAFAKRNRMLALDTESTGLNCYHPEWSLRTFQFGDSLRSYVLPAAAKATIRRILKLDIRWIGHNGPHDIRSIDQHLGFETGVVCAGETYLPAHYTDSRNQEEGGSGHGLKELATALIDRSADKWEDALKKEFKKIEIEIPGQFYKSGPRKGQQKVRKALLAEGWGLIDPRNIAYIAYAAADPILTFRLWRIFKPVVRQFIELYRFDHAVQLACDKLQRRGMRLDTHYTERLRLALDSKAKKLQDKALALGCKNIYSGLQIGQALLDLGADLTERTPKGQFKTTDEVLTRIADSSEVDSRLRELIQCILTAKRLSKRREAYADAMLREADVHSRIHPAINSIGARTTRMSVSKPALQQLPTKDEESQSA